MAAIGPSVGEVVVTPDGRGIIVGVGQNEFAVRHEVFHGSRDTWVAGSVVLYGLELYGKSVQGVWECGYGNAQMHCYLARNHAGPHLFKLPV